MPVTFVKAPTYNVKPFDFAPDPQIAAPAGALYNGYDMHGMAWSPDNQFVAIVINVSPWLYVFKVDSNGRIIARVANPSSLPSGLGNCVTFSPDGTTIAMGLNASPYVEAWAWTTAGFGTKASNPASLPLAASYAIAFNPASTEIAVGGTLSGAVSVCAYPWSAGAFGTKRANPGTAPAIGNCVAILWSPSGADIFLGGDGAPYLAGYPYSAGWGTKYTAPTTAGAEVDWMYLHPNLHTLVVACTGAPMLQHYTWTTATGFTAGPSGLGSGTQPSNAPFSCAYDATTGILIAVDPTVGVRAYTLQVSAQATPGILYGGALLTVVIPPNWSNTSTRGGVWLSPNRKWMAMVLQGSPLIGIVNYLKQQ